MDEAQAVKDILTKVQGLDISLRRKVNTLFAGQYRSAFKGQGMVFSDFREYIPGDDIRSISWNLTAKMGRPYIKTFEAEREAPLMLVADISRSLDFGAKHSLKKDVLALLVGLFAFCAQKSRDPVGLLLFSKTVESYIPPKKDPRQALYILREICRCQRRKSGTNLQSATGYLHKTLKRRGRVFLFSDFLLSQPFERDLKQIAGRHELVCFVIRDPLEESFPSLGLVDMEDLETGETLTFDTASFLFKKYWRSQAARRDKELKKQFASLGVERVFINTDRDIYRPVMNFFKERQNARLKFYG